MNTSYYGGIEITQLMALLKEGHPAFKKHDNGKIYMNITCWANSAPDKYGNEMSIQLNTPAGVPKKYIANLKKNKPKEEQPITGSDISKLQEDFAAGAGSLDDLPFDPMFNNL